MGWAMDQRDAGLPLEVLTGEQAAAVLTRLANRVGRIRPRVLPVLHNPDFEQLASQVLASLAADPQGTWTEMAAGTREALLARVRAATIEPEGIAGRPFISLPAGLDDMRQAVALATRSASPHSGKT